MDAQKFELKSPVIWMKRIVSCARGAQVDWVTLIRKVNLVGGVIEAVHSFCYLGDALSTNGRMEGAVVRARTKTKSWLEEV